MGEWVTLSKHRSHSSKFLPLQVSIRVCKMGHIWPTRLNLGEWVTLSKHGSHIKNVALGTMSHSGKNGSLLPKWIKLGIINHINMGHTHANYRTLKYESHWAKWVTFFQKGQTLENESHCINMSNTDQNYSPWRYELQWAKWVTFDQMGWRL